ncbi:MAG: DUF4258 domain-containing protein [Propionibacteriales bacterium]|nr:DUF4258 domain-containing protein [Propionibacteriales bacterium]
MRYGDHAKQFMTEQAHQLTEEAVEYAFVHGEIIATDPDDNTVTEGSDASGRPFRITVSPDQVILLVRPM